MESPEPISQQQSLLYNIHSQSVESVQECKTDDVRTITLKPKIDSSEKGKCVNSLNESFEYIDSVKEDLYNSNMDVEKVDNKHPIYGPIESICAKTQPVLTPAAIEDCSDTGSHMAKISQGFSLLDKGITGNTQGSGGIDGNLKSQDPETMAENKENHQFHPGSLINHLVEGPRITLPPSQLPLEVTPVGNNINVDRSNNSQQDDKKASSPSSSKEKTLTNSVIEQSSSSVDTSDPTHSVAKPKAKKTPNDFIFGKVIGEGSYSTVYLAKEVSTQREYAIKVCDKKHLIRERKTHFVMREKEILMKLEHPFFIKLAYTFQDSERLYYVLTYARNGELLMYLHKLSVFDVPCTKFYSAEIVLALEYLQSLGIIHRDLKPENILLGEDMHIKITDFGTAKLLANTGNDHSKEDAKRKNSFVGTAEYVSPEVLNNLPANYGSDLWALGCIIYQCLSGSMPFRSGNEYQTFQKIVKVEYDCPEGFPPLAKDLVAKLLVLEPTERLGMIQPDGMKGLKNHPFFEGINWESLPDTAPPRLMPYLPATASNPEFWGQEQRTGFDDQRLAEIITGQSVDGSTSPEVEELPIRILSQAEDEERKEKLRKQREENPFHQFVEDNLIIRQGFVDKRKGLFARKRMLLLTEGPHLYYVDAHNKVLKGEIPWSKYLRPEAKNFKIFFVHTPNRTYYLESRSPDAQQWVQKIQEIWNKYYDENGKK
ncbi:3-phosphoinositide-dependent protein kinase 1-like [Physella acuta]|uniref:3-phosphoinositide-dependent protein kinase 1-like n=1 Tax=Physella acuta TaxID=109671 RepID=UPI0027DB1D37|nr:3-phosphoinositide-dependent protein kinase 1-like [Physella acuta]XP_059172686.1 3-phosphoinositide-dependent protein kinase 1-like [Physella acuta]